MAWGLPVFCVGEFIRVVTHRRILNPPSTLPQAVSFLERILASPSCRIVRPGPDFVSLLTAVSLAAGARGNLVFDAQIVALCREHGISTILTNDRDFHGSKTRGCGCWATWRERINRESRPFPGGARQSPRETLNRMTSNAPRSSGPASSASPWSRVARTPPRLSASASRCASVTWR